MAQVRGYQDDGGPFPQRLHLVVLFARFYTDFLLLLRDWVALARREAASWPTTSDLGLTDGTRRMLQDLLQLGDQLAHKSAQTSIGRGRQRGLVSAVTSCWALLIGSWSRSWLSRWAPLVTV